MSSSALPTPLQQWIVRIFFPITHRTRSPNAGVCWMHPQLVPCNRGWGAIHIPAFFPLLCNLWLRFHKAVLQKMAKKQTHQLTGLLCEVSINAKSHSAEEGVTAFLLMQKIWIKYQSSLFTKLPFYPKLNPLKERYRNIWSLEILFFYKSQLK